MGHKDKRIDIAPKFWYETATVFIPLFLLSLNYIIYAFWGITEAKLVLRLLVAAALVADAAYQILKKQAGKSLLFVLAVVAVLGLQQGVISFNAALLVLLAAVLRTKRLSGIYAASYIISMLLLVLVLVCLVFGFVENSPYVVGDRYRMPFGFYNVNAAALFAFSGIITYVLSRKSFRIKEWALALLLTTFVYLTTDSRTAFLSMMVFLAAWLVLPKLPKKHCRILVLALVAIMFLTPAFWSLKVVNDGWVNQILSLRPAFYAQFIQENSIWNLLIGGSQAGEIDNYYLLQLFNCGIFLYVAGELVVLTAIDMLLKKGKYLEIGFCLSMLLYGQFEAVLIRPEIVCVPVFWVIIGQNFSVDGLKCLASGVYQNCIHLFHKKNTNKDTTDSAE